MTFKVTRLPPGILQRLDLHEVLTRIETKLDRILSNQHRETATMTETQNSLAALASSVERIKSVDASVLALVQGMSLQIARLAAQAGDPELPAKLQVFADELSAQADALAAAVQANTPAPPAAPAEG